MSIYLVTGVAGFIGSSIAEYLLKKNYLVIGIDNFDNYYNVIFKKYRLNLLKKYKNFIFEKIDIKNITDIKKLFENHKGITTIFHMAAKAGVRYSIKNPNDYIINNINGTVNILESMVQFKVKKLILASTSSVYSNSSMPFLEDLSINQTISPYSSSKKSAELFAYTYHYLYGIDISVLRYFTVYGPSGRPDMSILKFINLIDQEKPIEVYGNGEQSRDFTYIDDIVSGSFLAKKLLGYEILNLGNSHKPYSINYMIKIIENFIGKKAIIEYNNNFKGDVKETWACIDKSKKILKWEPKISFENGIKKTIIWYNQNKNWLQKIL